MYMKINEDKFNGLIDEIKTICESKNYSIPSIFKNHNLLKEHIFPDDEVKSLNNF